jgi:uncharacterized membrane protein YukC
LLDGGSHGHGWFPWLPADINETGRQMLHGLNKEIGTVPRFLTYANRRERVSETSVLSGNQNQEMTMSVKGQIKEAAGYVKEEAFEHGKSADSKIKAQEGRELRNEGRVEDGKAPKTAKPGKRHQ